MMTKEQITDKCNNEFRHFKVLCDRPTMSKVSHRHVQRVRHVEQCLESVGIQQFE